MEDPNPIVVETELDVRDWAALQAYVTRRAMELRHWSARDWLRGLLFPVAAATVLAWLALQFLGSGNDTFFPLVAGVFICAIAMVGIQGVRMRRFQPAPGSYMLARTRMEFDATGVRSTRKGHLGFAEWVTVESVDETSEHFFFALDRLVAYVLPKRSITVVTPEEFGARIREWHAARRSMPTQAHEQAVESLEPRVDSVATELLARSATRKEKVGFWRSLRANLLVGVRIFLLRRVKPTDLHASFDQVAALLALTLGAAVLLDWQRAEPGSQFAYYSLYDWALWLLLGLSACALLARSLSPRADTRAVLTASFASMPWVLLVLWAMGKLPSATYSDSTLALATIALLLVIGMRVAFAAIGFLKPAAVLVILLVACFAGGLQRYYFIDLHLWEVMPEPAASFTAWEATESTLFDQPIRISEVVEGLEPERPGVTDVFFVGFAGDGSQRVFRREVLFGQEAFARQMGSGKRSIALINDYQDRIAYPLATATGLRYSLELLGQRMNRDEDVLVLFLASHGSRESGISVQNGILPLNDVGPDEVQRALDASGIKWRIIIVSACYAGVFIEPLKSDTTVVITAADPDHNSFGCADDRDLTYFGEEFLRDALPVAPSLEEAFQTARVEIERRERAEKKTPSNPQIHVGDAIREKLAALGRLPLK
jgi:hypothetical protein